MTEPTPRYGLDERGTRTAVTLLGVLVVAKLILLVVFALNTTYVMDEYRHATFSLRLGELYQTLNPIKTALFVVFYGFAFWLADAATEIMQVARLQTVAAGFGIVWCIYAVARNLGRSRLEALFTVAVLLAFSTFMERAFRVRTEPLAVLFASVAVVLLTREAGKRPYLQAVLGGVVAGLAFLTTQKMVYLVVGLGLGILAQDFSRAGMIVGFWRAAGFSLGWALALLAYAVYFKGPEFFELIRAIFVRPVDLALNAHKVYRNLDHFVWQTLSRNIGVYAICLVGLGLALWRFKQATPGQRLALVLTLFTTIMVFRHNQPWPYVFLMCLPFLSLWACEVPRALDRLAPRIRVAGYVCIGVVLVAGLPRNLQYLGHDNQYQQEVAAFAESLLGPDQRYFDSIGMVSSRYSATFDWWSANRRHKLRSDLSAGDTQGLDRIFARQPKLWMLNYRMGQLWPWLAPSLQPSFVPVSSNVLVAGTILSHQSSAAIKPFVNHWSGSYAIYAANGRPVEGDLRVDGETVSTPVDLAVGEYEIGWDAMDETRFLLPAGLPATIAPQSSMNEFPLLFQARYSY